MGNVWHIGNTTVRNPYRLREGLKAIVARGYEGRLGKEFEEEVAYVLDSEEVIALREGTKDVTSIARKWRSALVKMGFIVPDLTRASASLGIAQKDLGAPFTLTEQGRRLLQAQGIRAINEVFLRSVAAIQLPNPIERRYKFEAFSPLQFVLQVCLGLQTRGELPRLSPIEFAAFIIAHDPSRGIEVVLGDISEYRDRRQSVHNKKKYDSGVLDAAAASSRVSADTLLDYQDLVFRYLKATGIFHAVGRGIGIVREQEGLARSIVSSIHIEDNPALYLARLFKGATLPIDNVDGSLSSLHDLRLVAADYGVAVNESTTDLSSPASISLLRHEYEDRIFAAKEIEYASLQRESIGEIYQYLKILSTNGRSFEYNGEEFKIPTDQRPAYFEWILWRLLLAYNDLKNGPSDVRRFAVDQDFLPIHHAPGGGADLIAEYEDSVLVVEVTLTDNSRQEAAEGEPVRRHVAQVRERFAGTGKDVYGLFLARNIDTNTAHTFFGGVWYQPGDVKVDLEIAPVTVSQLAMLVAFQIRIGDLDSRHLIQFIRSCVNSRALVDDAPTWKTAIQELSLQFSASST